LESGFFNLAKKSRLEVGFGNSWRCSKDKVPNVNIYTIEKQNIKVGRVK
jgi:hypothetical protein